MKVLFVPLELCVAESRRKVQGAAGGLILCVPQGAVWEEVVAGGGDSY